MANRSNLYNEDFSQNCHKGAEIHIFWPENKKIFLYWDLDN